jgi:hypothetical protein
MAQIERKSRVFDIGKAMGDAHGRAFWLWDDAHEGNMAWQAGQGITVFDVAQEPLLVRPAHAGAGRDDTHPR